VRDLFPNAWVIAKREYGVRVRNRTFAILTAALMLVGLGLALAPLLFRALGGDEPTRIGVVIQATDPPANAIAFLDQSLNGAAGTTPNGGSRYAIELANDATSARQGVSNGTLDGALTIGRNDAGDLTFDYFADAFSTDRSVLAIQSAVSNLAVSDRLAARGVTDLPQVFAPAAFAVEPLHPDRQDRSAEDVTSGYLLGVVLVVVIFMAIILYGNWVAVGVAEEKSSRVMELLITAATPRQLLFGKVLGNGAAGLTQYLGIVVAAVIGFVAQGPLSEALFNEPAGSSDFTGLTAPVLITFGVFFVTGFILYCTLYAALGALVSRQEDVQQIVMPMTVVGMIGYFAAFGAASSPDATWAKLLSFVPFFSPYLMPLRVVNGSLSLLEFALALALMLVFIWLAIIVAARIYAAGVLLYGQRPGFRKVLAATLGSSARAR
jgi:ABC-2 type transport system permease protein